jgi:hypothetical protein
LHDPLEARLLSDLSVGEYYWLIQVKAGPVCHKAISLLLVIYRAQELSFETAGLGFSHTSCPWGSSDSAMDDELTRMYMENFHW